ncbi:cell wall metabolism sensor histidine kinase WalK [Microbacterium sp. RURRCA19A]|uniref:sensor histidine kinase n=1 Tax=Microbacterium sp. RURRCA19A TaxID=1907391 RepID=UPI000955F93A|nr:HAMP domain-containing sensor histidine kinase [Microbacterium sp. RURRCA19A]SIS11213.1 two-component system, OmpR family, sensor kinase [Microbacterium sp. RURRCA19A]
MSRRPLTLQRALVIGASALVAVALLIMSVATITALRAFVYDRLDEQVQGGLMMVGGPRDGGHGQSSGADAGASSTPAPTPSGSVSGSGGRGPSPRVGSLQLVIGADGSAQSSSYTQSDGTVVTLSADQIAILQAAVPTDGVPVTADLGGDLGAFRVAARDSNGTTVFSGISLADSAATTTALTTILIAVGAATLLAAIAGLSFLVRRALRPLDRVAAVAQRVSGLSLGRGDVDIPDRVAPADTDTRTEVGRVGASLNDLLGHVQAALAARAHSENELRRFIADASHELRTPLASVRGYAQLTLSGPEPMSSTQQRSLERIESESRRMTTLVEDLLLLARLDAGQRLRVDDVELPLLAIDAVSDAQAVDRDREWRLDVASDDPLTVPGDEDRLRQVVANLLRNAHTHTPPGTVVTTTIRREGDEAVLSVTDTGPGIDPVVADTLFERFARGDRARNRDAGSTGLGLSIAQAIVAAHGGSLDVRSRPGETTFTVRLPAFRSSPVTADA